MSAPLVLDTSAIVAYAGGSVDVGEPMAEVRDAGGVVVVPVVCLAEAARSVADDMLRMLVGNAEPRFRSDGEPHSYGGLGEDVVIPLGD